MISIFHIAVCRKPVEGTVAQNVMKHGVGGINIDGCRVGTEKRTTAWAGNAGKFVGIDGGCGLTREGTTTVQGRFPANIIHDGNEEIVREFPTPIGHGDSGSAARFFKKITT